MGRGHSSKCLRHKILPFLLPTRFLLPFVLSHMCQPSDTSGLYDAERERARRLIMFVFLGDFGSSIDLFGT
jgi:hypothetical protein